MTGHKAYLTVIKYGLIEEHGVHGSYCVCVIGVLLQVCLHLSHHFVSPFIVPSLAQSATCKEALYTLNHLQPRVIENITALQNAALIRSAIIAQ